jgi:hypothetical protein
MSNAFPNESTQSPLSRCPITLTTAKHSARRSHQRCRGRTRPQPDRSGRGALVTQLRCGACWTRSAGRRCVMAKQPRCTNLTFLGLTRALDKLDDCLAWAVRERPGPSALLEHILGTEPRIDRRIDRSGLGGRPIRGSFRKTHTRFVSGSIRFADVRLHVGDAALRTKTGRPVRGSFRRKTNRWYPSMRRRLTRRRWLQS